MNQDYYKTEQLDKDHIGYPKELSKIENSDLGNHMQMNDHSEGHYNVSQNESNEDRKDDQEPNMKDESGNSMTDTQKGKPMITQTNFKYQNQKNQFSMGKKDLRPKPLDFSKCAETNTLKPDSFFLIGSNFLIMKDRNIIITKNQIIRNDDFPIEDDNFNPEDLKNIANKTVYLDPADFIEICLLGKNTLHSFVDLICHKPSKICYARKNYNFDTPEVRDELIKEYNVFSNVKSGYIIKLYGGYLETKQVKFILEFMNSGSLEFIIHIMKKHQIPMPEEYIAYIVRKVIKGLRDLHKNQIIHRDLKPSNILLNNLGEIKLADFGVAKKIDENLSKKKSKLKGTTKYLSPERIETQENTTKLDIWSLGIIIYQLAKFGGHPYSGTNSGIVMNEIKDSKLVAPQLDSSRFSENLCDFVGKCLIKDSAKRPDVLLLLKHPFMKRINNSKVMASNFMDFLNRNIYIYKHHHQVNAQS